MEALPLCREAKFLARIINPVKKAGWTAGFKEA
jgi:hypothetical protein